MPLSSSLQLRVRSSLTGTGDLSTPRADMDRTYETDYSNGSGAFQVNNGFSDLRSLGASANEDIDLAGALNNALGATLTFLSVKKIVIVAARANTTVLSITRPASNGAPIFKAAGDGIDLHPGGKFVAENPSAAGWAITAGTADLINIANAAGAIAAYEIIIEGVTA